MKRILRKLLAIAVSLSVMVSPMAVNASEVVGTQTYPYPTLSFGEVGQTMNVILDTDMSTDIDDAMAIRVAINLDRIGKIRLLAVNGCVSGNERAINGLLNFSGYGHVYVGKSSYSIPDSSPYWGILADYAQKDFHAIDSVRLYRTLLAGTEGKVNIITTGYLTNIEALLKSEPDDISPLTGYELVAQKVGMLCVTGGSVPKGRDNNFFYEPVARTAANYVAKYCPVQIAYFTNNLGGYVICGGKLQREDKTRSDILTRSLDAFGATEGSYGWDPFVVWCVGMNDMAACNLSYVHTIISISPQTGYNEFFDDPAAPNVRITRTNENHKWYANQIDALMER